MKKIKIIVGIFAITVCLFVGCTSGEAENTEPEICSTGFDWYSMLGTWTSGDEEIEFYDDDTFYDTRYEVGGTWDESDYEGDVILYYDAVPDFIVAQGWDMSEQYYEWYSLDYNNEVLFDDETGEIRFRKD